MHSILWEFEQQRQITGAVHTATAAKDDIQRALHAVSTLERSMEKLTLVSRAMWEILQAQTGLTEEQLAQKVTEIDLRDGELDGRVRVAPAQCGACGRKISKRHVRCMYCGAEKTSDSEFGRI